MKRLVAILSVLLFAAVAVYGQGQPPRGFNYQALVYQDGAPVSERDVVLEVSLQDASATVYYTERHSIKTAKTGLVNVAIGEGNSPQGTMDAVPWEKGIFVAVKADVGGGLVSLGAPVKLQAVPYALFAMATPRVLGTKAGAEADDPIFEVVNSKGEQVLGVYEGGVRIQVSDAALDPRGPRGGFAVGTHTPERGGASTVNRFTIADGGVSFVVDEKDGMRGPRGGFAVGTIDPLRGGGNMVNRFMLSGPRLEITVDPTTRGPRGGFAIGQRSYESLRSGGLDVQNLLNIDDRSSYFTLGCDQVSSTFSLRKRCEEQEVIMNFTAKGELQSGDGVVGDVVKPAIKPTSSIEVEWSRTEDGLPTVSNAGRWLYPTVKLVGGNDPLGYTIALQGDAEKYLETRMVYSEAGHEKVLGLALKEGLWIEQEVRVSPLCKICLLDNPSVCKEVEVASILSERFKAVYLEEEHVQFFPGMTEAMACFGFETTISQKIGSDYLLGNLPIGITSGHEKFSFKRLKEPMGGICCEVTVDAAFAEQQEPGSTVEFTVTLTSPYFPDGKFEVPVKAQFSR